MAVLDTIWYPLNIMSFKVNYTDIIIYIYLNLLPYKLRNYRVPVTWHGWRQSALITEVIKWNRRGH